MMARFVLVAILTLVAARQAVADPIMITTGTVGEFNGIDLPGFTVGSSSSRLQGILLISGGLCCVFDPGDIVNVSRGFPVDTLAMTTGPQIVNGTTYHNVFLRGGLMLTAVPFVAPPLSATSDFTFTTPFHMSGLLTGFDRDPSGALLFSVPVVGSGTVSVIGWARPGEPNYVGQGAFFQFQEPSPTPEPASLALLACGATGVFGASIRRRLRGVPLSDALGRRVAGPRITGVNIGSS
jgi:hypothetical protein